MKYETPELTALNAINAVQSRGTKQFVTGIQDAPNSFNEHVLSYADWE